MLRNRKRAPQEAQAAFQKLQDGQQQPPPETMSNFLRKQPVWLVLAIASGGCAAINGVFAKLSVAPCLSAERSLPRY